MATLGCSNITVLLTIFIVIIISSSPLSRHHHNLIRVAEVGNREAKKNLKVFGERATKMTYLKVFVTKCCFKILAGMLHPRYLNMNPFVKISPKAFLKARKSQPNLNSRREKKTTSATLAKGDIHLLLVGHPFKLYVADLFAATR